MADEAEEGPLIVIGGHEDKEGDRVILKALVERLKGRRLVVATVASRIPEEYFEEYSRVFHDLGVEQICELYLNERSEASRPETLACFEDAGGIFFTGGDQMRIASQIGDTPVDEAIREVWRSGGVIAGTSAGASVMSDVMLIGGASGESHRIGDLQMAAGLGFIPQVVIDQHFAERGRIGRLMGAVSQNPRMLGVGVDENTAFILQDRSLQVIGQGAIYVVDGADISHSNIAEGQGADVLSVYDMRVHILSAGDRFDLDLRRPSLGADPDAKKGREK
jgi:cyanophycinase